MSLNTELIIRVIIIVSVIDVIEFYAINRNGVITVPFAIGVILITVISLLINIWYCLYRRGIK